MSDMRFFGKYAICKSESKNKGAHLIGPDNIVGNEVSLEFKNDDGKCTVWAINKFGAEIGCFDNQTSYLLNVTRARGWNIHALLSMIGLTDFDKEDPDEKGYYWAEIVLFGFAPRYENYSNAFASHLSKKISDGIRPDIDLTSSSIDTLLKEKGNWLPAKKMSPLPKKTGTVVIKSKIKPSEVAIEAGRNKNIGCYVVSYLFIALLILGVILLVKALLGL